MTCCFVVYDPASGSILRSGHCSNADDVPHQAQAGEAVMRVDEAPRNDRFQVDVTKNPPVVVPRAA